MSSKNTKGKISSKSQTVNEVKQTEQVVETKQSQKGGKKSTKQSEEPVVPVAEKVVEPVVETKQSLKGGKKSTKQSVEPVVPVAEQVVETKQSQKGGKKSTKQSVEPVAEPVEEPVVETKQSQKGGKKSTKQVAEPKIEVEIEAAAVGEEEESGKLRYFRLFYNDEYQGRYRGKKPKQAANKAFSYIVKDMKKNGNQKGGVNVDINFSIRECTRNSKHKEYTYVGIREKLNNPVEVKIENEDGSVKNITYSFHNKISKAPKLQV